MYKQSVVCQEFKVSTGSYLCLTDSSLFFFLLLPSLSPSPSLHLLSPSVWLLFYSVLRFSGLPSLSLIHPLSPLSLSHLSSIPPLPFPPLSPPQSLTPSPSLSLVRSLSPLLLPPSLCYSLFRSVHLPFFRASSLCCSFSLPGRESLPVANCPD